MSKLEELIQELCPDGVETFPLEECCNILDKKRKPVTKNSREKGEYPYYGANGVQDYVSDYIFNGKFVLVGEDGSVITKSGTPVVTWAEGKIWVNNHAHVIEEKSGTMLRYLYFYIQTIDVTSLIHGNIPKLTGRDFRSLKIALPPLEIQREIVSILDNFTNLTAELTAELTARKTQYAYYRDNLLTTKPQWNHVKILDMLSQPITDGPHTTPQFVQNGVPFISVDSIWDGKIHFEKRRGYITEEFDEECCKKYKPQKNDVYMVKSGSTTGKVAFVDTDIRFNIWSPLAAMRVNEKNSARFLFYLLQTERVQKQVKAKSSHGSQPNLGMRELEQFEVDIPPLDVQNRIVNVLDNFEKICSDLNIGLPAEIEARQKQYEYHRDKLLTFAENGNTILSRAEQSRAEQSRALIKLLQYVFGYAMLPLSEVANVFRGEYITKKNENAGNIPVILGGQEPAYYIDRANHIGEIVAVARSGASAGFVSYWDEPIFITDGFGYEVKKEVAIPKYLYYVLKNKEIELNGMKRGAGVPHVSGERLGEINLPVPPIEEQKRIISILDRFDSICNDLTSGLPAEIEARQKQYEYYRDKLLTFKERG